MRRRSRARRHSDTIVVSERAVSHNYAFRDGAHVPRRHLGEPSCAEPRVTSASGARASTTSATTAPRSSRRCAKGASPFVKVIAEVKRRSPSKGGSRPTSTSRPLAATYRDAGASAISVLTDERLLRRIAGGPARRRRRRDAARPAQGLHGQRERRPRRRRAGRGRGVADRGGALSDDELTSFSSLAARAWASTRWSRCTTRRAYAARSTPGAESSASISATCAPSTSIATAPPPSSTRCRASACPSVSRASRGRRRGARRGRGL